MKTDVIELAVSTPDGQFIARYSEKGLAGLSFPAARKLPATAKPSDIPAQVRAWHRVTEAALKKILAGNQPKEFPPLAWTGTDFQKSVWRQMRKITTGKTKSYGEIAQAIGKPKAVRAVGGACGANPIPVLVPCHRVLAADNKIGGFSGGMHWKRDLLTREGVRVKN